MRKSLIVLLVCFMGCNASQDDDNLTSKNAPSVLSAETPNVMPSIFAVPRPNSGTFSTAEATELLPQFLERSTPIQNSDPIVAQWESPTQGIRIHVTGDDSVEIVDYLGRKLSGVESIDSALNSTMTFGNARSVLLTSDTAGWESPTRKYVIELLFQPSVQIYLVGHNGG